MSDRSPNTTTEAGIPVPSDEHALTVGPAGPALGARVASAGPTAPGR